MLIRSRFTILTGLCLLLTACSNPAPIAQLPATVALTDTAQPPTNTPIPTATSISAPTVEPTATTTATATASPSPTSTPALTPTNTATKVVATKVVTATTAATKASTAQPVAASSGASSGAVPANAPLNVAVQRTMDNLLELNKGINGVMVGAAYTCGQFLERYNAITQAPEYEVAGQPQDVQTAYGYYRSAIDTLKSQLFEIWRTCDRGGGIVDKLKWGEALRGLSGSINTLDQAVKLLPAAPAAGPQPTATLKPTPVPNTMALSDLLLQTMDRLHLMGGYFDGAQLNFDANFCAQFEPLYKTIITEVALNQDGKPAAWIDSYGAYKAVIQYTQNKLYRAHEVCQAGGGTIGKSEFGDMRRAVDAAAIAAARAYDVMKNAGLLGQ